MNSVQQLHPIQLHNRLIRSVRLLAVALLMAFLWLGIFSQAAHAQDGTITFVKNAVGANGTFTFTNPDGDPDLDGLSILTTNNSGTSATFTKAAGTYTVTENALTGWALSDIEVAGDTDSGSTWSITNTQIVIDLDAGENITVTWTNADQNYTVNSAELTGVTTTGVTIGPVASGVSLQILGLDYGDLPDSDAGAGGTAVNSPSYNTNITTTSGAIGASHIITPGLHLGAGVDHESDGQPSATATGDDTNDSVAGLTDDEDGVTFPTFIPSQSADVTVSVVNTTGQTAYVYGFIDFDGDGAFTTAGEAVSTTVTTSGDVTLTFTVPVNADTAQQVGTRIRLSTDSGLGADGAASDGEVEDYLIQIQQLVNLGNQVWHDYDNDGQLDANEPGIDSVAVELYRDTNGDGSFTLGTDELVTTTTTSNGGYYTFTNLLPTTAVTNTYMVVITDTNFSGSGPLVEYISSDGNGEPAPDPDDDVDNDDNGSPNGTLGVTGGIIASLPISLTVGSEPMTTTVSGDSNWTVDFGVWQPVSLGNRIWYDANDNGIQDSGELGISNVVLNLLDESSNAITDPTSGNPITTTTNASGLYTFTDLISGTYIVEVSYINFATGGVLENYSSSIVTELNADNDNNTDDNGQDNITAASPTTGGVSSNPVHVTPGNESATDGDTNTSSNLTVDFGFVANDYGDLPDGNATNSPNYNTDLGGTPGPSHPITTALQMGVNIDAELGGQPTAAADGDDVAGTPDDEDAVSLPNFRSGGAADVTVIVTNTSGSVAYIYGFIDFDGDGAFTTTGEAISQTVNTGTNGGTVTLSFNVPANADTTQQLGARFRLSTDTGLGADGAASNDEVEDYLIQVEPTTLNLGNRVWIDANGDGVQNDPTDPAASGLTVTLLDATSVISTTTTDANGYYTFTNLPEGVYTVTVEMPSGYALTIGGSDPDNDIDTDSNAIMYGIGAASLPVSLTLATEPMTTTVIGDSNFTVDFGFVPVSIGNFVWHDLDADGAQDGGEPGISGVIVELWDSVGVPISHTAAYRDEFTVDTTYVGSNGTLDWSNTVWSENDDGSPTAGDIQIVTDLGDLALRFAGTFIISRTVDMSAFVDGTATLSFEYRREDLETTGNTVNIEYSTNGGGSWITLDTITGATNDVVYRLASYTITSSAANTLIRISSSNMAGAANDRIFIDNIEIAGNRLVRETTDANGFYTFAGGEDWLDPSTNYQIAISLTQPALITMTLTDQDAGGVTSNDPIGDDSDSDAAGSGGYAIIDSATSQAFGANLGFDVGFFQLGTVEGTVYIDEDSDGVYTAGTDTPLSNVDVVITDTNGMTYTVPTNANGYYSQTVPAGNTTANADESDPDFPATSGLTPNDPNGTGDNTDPGSTNVPANGTGIENAGFLPPVQYVEGTIYIDEDGDGIYTAGTDTPLPNVDVLITDTNGMTYTVPTDANGYYSQTVPAGNTTANVDESDPNFPATSGLTPNDPNGTGDNTDPGSATVPANGVGVENAGFLPPVQHVEGTVYIDEDGDGVYTPGTDTPLPNVDVVITDTNGMTYTVPTNANGYYSQTVPAGNTTANADENDPDFPATSGLTPNDPNGTGDNTNPGSTTVPANGVGVENAGFLPPVQHVEGTVYIDEDGDGVYTAGTDTPLPNVDVVITDTNGMTYTVPTNANGYYSQTVPAGNTTANADENDPDFPATSGLTPNDPNGTGDNTDPGTTTVPANGVGVENAGFLPPVQSVEGTVYIDEDGDGVYTPGTDTPLPNVDVVITDSNVMTYTVPTDANGYYSQTVPVGTTGVNVDESDPGFPATSGLTQNDPNGTGDNTDPGTTTVPANGVGVENAGYLPPVQHVEGTVYIDEDGDGIYTPGTDIPLPNVDVVITDTNGMTYTVPTDANGYYSQTVPVGTTGVNVDESDPGFPATSGLTQNDPNGTGDNTDPGSTTVPANGVGVENAGYLPPVQHVEGTVYIDEDGDGVYTPGTDTPIPNVDVVVTDSNSATYTVPTDANGYYSQTVPVGTTGVDVDESDPDFPATAGLTPNDPNGTGDNTDPGSTTVPAKGTGSENAGFLPPVQHVEGTVYIDEDGDGVYTLGTDTPLPNVDVLITDTNGMTYTVPTDTNGYYSQTVPAGNTTANVDENDPDFPTTAGLTPNDPNGTGDNTDPGNVNVPANGTGTENSGYLPPMQSVEGTIYIDVDGDGVYTVGTDTPIPNVDVLITDVNSQTYTVSTDANGYYSQAVLPGSTTVDVNESDPDFPTTAGLTPNDPNGTGDNTDPGSTTVPANGVGVENSGYLASPSVAALGGRVWHDLDADESGIANVTIELYDSSDTLISTTLTTGDGSYDFSNLEPGDYYVKVTTPAGYEPSPQDQGGDDTLDSDMDPVTGQTILTTLTAGENDLTWDAGLREVEVFELASMGNFVWHDLDGDGVQDVGEPGIPGVTVELYDSTDTLIDTRITDDDGNYSFVGLRQGDYYVVFTPPVGNELSPQDQGGNDTLDSDADPTNGRTPTISLVAGDNDVTWDAGLFRGASIGSNVWNDANGNGIQDPSEEPIGGVTVQLFDSNGNLVDTTTTNDNGVYDFSGLVPGDYYVQFVTPDGFVPTRANQGEDDALDSDVDPQTLRSGVTTLDAGENDPTWDAGFTVPASIGNSVWDDGPEATANGIRDAGENGIPGVTVILYDAAGDEVDRTTTAADGSYQFSRLIPGEYSLEFIVPTGFKGFTVQNRSSDETTDSDVDPNTGRTELIELSPGENDLNWHAGLVLETPTAIELTNLSATIRRGDQGDVLVVKWSTSAETFTLGFHVHIGPNNNYTNATRKTSQMVFSQGSQGGSYEARIPYDAQTDPSLEKMRIWLVEIDINNNELTYGPTLVSRSRFIFLPFITSGGATDGSPRGPRGAVPSSQPTDNLESREVEQPQKVMKIDERVARWVCHVLRDAAISSASPNPIVRGFGRLCDR